MHIAVSACGNKPCWLYSNKNVSGQLYYYKIAAASKFKIESIFIKKLNAFNPFLQVLIKEKIMLFTVTARPSK